MLGKTQPFLEYLSNELSNGDQDECKVWQEFLDSLKTKEDIKFDKISRLFTKIMSIFAVIQEWGNENGRVTSLGQLSLGVVHKLRLQEEGGRWSKKLTFCKLSYHRKCQSWGGYVVKKSQNLSK